MGRRDGSAWRRRRRLILVLSRADLAHALPMGDLIEALKVGFEAFSSGGTIMPHRTTIETPRGSVLVMPAFVPPRALSTKIVSVFPGNADRGLAVIDGLVLLVDSDSGRPRAILDGAFLTAQRTGAASGVATDLLARPEARIGAIIGTGPQARTQALAIDAVRRLTTIRVYGRDATRRAALAASIAPRVRAAVETVDSPGAAIEGADIVCTATSAESPVVPPERIAPGSHINAVGSYKPTMRELDDTIVARARVFVDSIEAALAEAGELIHAIEAGATERDAWVEIGRVVSDSSLGRTGNDDVTLFKSVGLAVQDAVAAELAVRNAVEQGLGTEIAL